ncbi:MAG: hypothetical protein M3177_09265, partial [Pseudomonadota bacterium]|nr:hypothetical protein [Pseudomonadota bacterium]
MRQLAAGLGIPVPETPDLAAAGIAALIILATLALAWAAGRWGGPRIVGFWERRAGPHGEGLAPRMCAIIRYLTVWILLALALRANAWP